MRILVLDDSTAHRFSAPSLLRDHDLTVVSTYEEAEMRLGADKFDAFLGDLMLPASEKTLSPKAYHFVGEEMPLGTILALLALKHGVKYVAVLTDTNHHMHPASAAFDEFQPRWTGPFAVGDTRILCGGDDFVCYVDEETGAKVDWAFIQADEGKKKYPEIEWRNHRGLVLAKDWAEALAQLIAGPKKT